MVFKSIKIMNHNQAIQAIKEARALLPLVIKNLQRPVPKGYEGEIIEHARTLIRINDFLEQAREYYGDLDSLLESEKK